MLSSPEIVFQNNKLTSKSNNSIIFVNNITRNFGTEKGIFNVNIEIQTGEVVSIIGPNGSGKSTLLNCIGFFDHIDIGQISINGISWGPLSNKNNHKIAYSQIQKLRGTTIGTVFQDSKLWPHLNVIDNLILPLRKVAKFKLFEAEQKAKSTLELLGVLDRSMSKPFQLSGGLQQRVVIARSLALDPKILLLDEVTNALDPKWIESLRIILREFVKNGGSILNVGHQMGFIRRLSDRVIFLNQGNILETGTPCEIFDTPRSTELNEFLTNA